MFQRAGRIAIVVLLVAVVAVAAVAGDLWAQCAMCGSTLKPGGDPLTQSISRSVILMASMPFALFATVAGWLAWKIRRGRNGAPAASGMPDAHAMEKSPMEGTDA